MLLDVGVSTVPEPINELDEKFPDLCSEIDCEDFAEVKKISKTIFKFFSRAPQFVAEWKICPKKNWREKSGASEADAFSNENDVIWSKNRSRFTQRKFESKFSSLIFKISEKVMTSSFNQI